MTDQQAESTPVDPLVRARDLATCDGPADSPDDRSIPHYLQSIALSLADIAQTLRSIDWREGGR